MLRGASARNTPRPKKVISPEKPTALTFGSPPQPLTTVAPSLAYWIPLGQAAASIRVIHPLRVMLVHPGLAIT
jgi:hypothetical protein